MAILPTLIVLITLCPVQKQQDKSDLISKTINQLKSSDEELRDAAMRQLINLEAREELKEVYGSNPELRDRINKIEGTLSLFKLIPRFKNEWKKDPWSIEELANAKKKNWPYIIGNELKYWPDFITETEKKMIAAELLKDASMKKRVKRIGMGLDQPKMEETWFFIQTLDNEDYTIQSYSSFALEYLSTAEDDKTVEQIVSAIVKKLEDENKRSFYENLSKDDLTFGKPLPMSSKSMFYLSGKLRKKVVQNLISKLTNEQSGVRFTALQLLNFTYEFDEDESEQIARSLIKNLSGYNKDSQALAITLLGKAAKELEDKPFEEAVKLLSRKLGDSNMSWRASYALEELMDRISGKLLEDTTRSIIKEIEQDYTLQFVFILEKLSKRVEGTLAREVAEALLDKYKNYTLPYQTAEALGNMAEHLSLKLVDETIEAVESAMNKSKRKMDQARYKIVSEKLYKRKKILQKASEY